MKIIDGLKQKNLIGTIALILALVVIAGWYFGGAPIPGRYQISTLGSEGVVMLDTTTGKIRLFSYRTVGSSSHREFQGRVEFFELTK